MNRIPFCSLIFISLAFPLFANSVLLKSGETIKGNITSQDAESIVVQEANGNSRTISKKKILKVVYKEVSEEALQEIRKEEERKLALKSEKESKDKELEIEEEKKKNEKLAVLAEPESKAIPSYALFTTSGKNCVPFASKTEWFWLYGNIPFSEPDWNVLLPKEFRTIQMRYTSTWKDTLSTIFIGSITSITRKTRVIEVCDMDPAFKVSLGK